MTEGRESTLWAHTSNVMAILANIHRDPKKAPPFSAAQFNPYSNRRPKPRRRKVTVRQLTDDIMRVVGGEKRPRRPLTGLGPRPE